VSAPALDHWLPDAAVRVAHHRAARCSPQELWAAAGRVALEDTRVLGQLVRWRIPGLPADLRYVDLLRSDPFVALEHNEWSLLSGLCGRIWTLRRDYPRLDGPEAFRAFDRSGQVRVLYANWVTAAPTGAVLHAEVRVSPTDTRGRLGLTAVRPLIATFQNLIATEALTAAVRTAQHDEKSCDGPTIGV
jgi:hypothetical protein